MSLVKRLFGRAVSSDDPPDYESAAAAGGDCNGNLPSSSVAVTTRIVRPCRRHGNAVRDCLTDAERRQETVSRPEHFDPVCCCHNCIGGLPPSVVDDAGGSYSHPVRRRLVSIAFGVLSDSLHKLSSVNKFF